MKVVAGGVGEGGFPGVGGVGAFECLVVFMLVSLQKALSEVVAYVDKHDDDGVDYDERSSAVESDSVDAGRWEHTVVQGEK